MGVVSPRLVSIFLDSCSMIDSIFRHLFPDRKIKDKKINRKNLTMAEYKTQYKSDFEKLKSLLYVTPPKYLIPFKEWNNGKIKWWQDYNEVKHNRIKKFDLATLENTLNALCGLYQVIIKMKEYKEFLFRAGWIKLREYAIEYAIENLTKNLLVETNLFVTPLRSDEFPDNIYDISPALYRNNDRLSHFLGHTN